MIKEKELLIDITPRNITFYKNKNYICKIGDIINIKIEDLNITCKKEVTAICECGEEKSLRYEKYIQNKNRCGYYGCKKCSTKKRILINQQKYGVDFTTQLSEVKEKLITTNLEKYGVGCIFSSQKYKDQIKYTNLEKYGVEYPQQSKEIRNKSKKTLLENWGVDSYSKTSEFKIQMKEYHTNKTEEEKILILEKTINTTLDRYGVTSYTKTNQHRELMGHIGRNPDNIIKRINTVSQKNIDKFNNRNENLQILKYINFNYEILDVNTNEIFTISLKNFYYRNINNIPLNTITHPIKSQKSFKEEQLTEFIKTYIINIKTKDKTVLNGKELDIYLPDYNLAFEFNGLYWHSEINKNNDYHLNKTLLCEENKIDLFHIWEDEWLHKRRFVESKILDLLNLNPVISDNFIIKQINKNEAEYFHNENNLTGYANSSFHYGIYIEDELYYVMSFYQIGGILEITRFTTKLFIILKNSENIIIEHVKNIYNPTKIIYYAERRLLDYKKLNFNIIEYINPDYYLVKGDNRYNKWDLYKLTDDDDTVHLNMESLLQYKIYRIFDCGKILLESK